MTLDKAKITGIVFAAVQELNQQLPKAKRLEAAVGTPLSGAGGKLDSLGLLNLVVLVEQKVEQESGVTLMLADDAAMAAEPNPFQTLGTLVDHVQRSLEQKLNE